MTIGDGGSTRFSVLGDFDIVAMIPYAIGFLVVMLVMYTFFGESFMLGFLALVLLSMVLVNADTVAGIIGKISKGVSQ